MENSQAISNEQLEAKKDKDPIVKVLMKVFWILLAVTLIEVGLALAHFELGFLHRDVLNGLFILLTFVKAFYIVAEFMHFKHEKKALVLIILIPLFFLMWGIGATMWEGSATLEGRENVKTVIHSSTAWDNYMHNLEKEKDQ